MEIKTRNFYPWRLFAFFLLCALCVKNSYAQQLLFSDKYNPNAKRSYGANERHFLYTFYGLGYALGKSDTALRLQYGWPNTYYLGIRYKLKLNSIFSTGLSLLFQYDKYRIKQSSDRSFTDSLFEEGHSRHKKERFSKNTFSSEAFLRINLDPHRGEYMGYYLEGGIAAGAAFTHYFVIDKLSNGSELSRRYSNLPFRNDVQYYSYAKIGLNTVALVLRYRMSPWFSNNLPEPPPYLLSLEFNPYSH